MHLKRKIAKTAAVVLSAAMVGLFGTANYYSSRLPETLTADIGSGIEIAEYPEITCASFRSEAIAASETYPASRQATLSLFGAIPIKNVEIREEEAPMLAVGGDPFGIKLLMDGVMVTELGEITLSDGKTVCPAREAGIKVGDVIRLADMQPVTSNSQIQGIISNSGGRTIKLSVNRGGNEFIAYLEPVYSEEQGVWLGGMWVRDSIAGIGTITFINPETGEFAGLGHPICDSDTGELVPISSGEAVAVEITEAKAGQKGIPGELRGAFTSDGSLGILNRNNGCGVYGILTDEARAELCSDCEIFKMAYRQEIRTGKAEILSTVEGGTPQRYEIEIENVDYSGDESGKNMVIRITDEELLKRTGGIVQGMSGSPIIQDGKLIGAVTHVFVADPTRGYGIFAENMAEYLIG
ncbi:MAG: SpoIVB peptidase [Ruminococcus sp.]|nr:SpoIVB peptidase [Ruminococcus sp.]